MKWNTQDGDITTNIKVDVKFTWPELSATNVVTWKCHISDSIKGRYNMILERYLWTELVINSKWSDHIIKSDDGNVKGSTTPIVNWVRTNLKI